MKVKTMHEPMDEPMGLGSKILLGISILVVIVALFLTMMFFILKAQADDDGTDYTKINLTDIPIRVADSLNIDNFSGQLICSCIFIMIVLIPIAMITKGKYGSMIPECAITLVVMGICIGIGWLPVWVFLVFCMLIGLMIAVRMRKIITGGGGGE